MRGEGFGVGEAHVVLRPIPSRQQVCRECASQAVASDGEPLQFIQSGPRGEFEARYAATRVLHPSHDCWISGQHCRADVAHFGGIVIQAV